MAGSFGDAYERLMLDFALGTTPAADRWLALFTSDPLDAGTGTECVGGTYVRMPITFDAAVSNTSGTSAVNAAAITFARALASWGTISHWAIYTAVSGGTLVAHATFDTPTAIGVNQIFEVADGALTATQA
jgi:hypothetical protein